jgi:alanine-synthesizing transaminase
MQPCHPAGRRCDQSTEGPRAHRNEPRAFGMTAAHLDVKARGTFIIDRMFSRRTEWNLAPNRFTDAVRAAQKSGKRILDLTLSNPTRAGIAYDQKAILDSLAKTDALDYDPQPKGLKTAREAVSAYYRERGDQISSEQLVLTTSTSEAYSYVLRLLANPDDEILVSKPSYPLFEFLADLNDVKLVPYPLLYDHGWQIDLHSLQHAITEKSCAIVCVHSNNPTGSYVNAEERSYLNDLCAERGMALIIDEVFLDYAHDEHHHFSFVSNTGALTFTLSGLSKVSALPQMKLAWIAVSGPEKLATEAVERLEVMADTYLSVSTPVQLAAPVLLEQRKTVQSQLMRRIHENLRELDCKLSAQRACARLDVEGGWYVVLRVPVMHSDEDLAIALLQECGVLVHPGHFYDFPNDGHLVASLITEPTIFREGLSKIVAFFEP